MKKKLLDSLKHSLWKFLKLLLVVAIIGAVVYRVKFAPMPVIEHQITHGEIVSEVMGTGTLDARVKATISSKISGLISQVRVDQGDRVSRGDLLVELDNEELLQQVKIAKATLATKEAAIARLKADRIREEAILTQATRLLKRMQKAITSRSVSQTDLDKSNETFAVAKAGLARAEAALVEGQKDLAAGNENLQYSKAVLANTKVLAPFDGLIIRRQREPGDIVLPGSAVLKIISTDELWLSAWVDETEMAKLKTDQIARVIFRSEPERSYVGKVSRLGKEADRETREFVVDVSVSQPPGNWAIGQRGEVYIETGRKESVLLVPAKFIQWKGDTPGVFVKEGARAEWRQLKLGLRGETSAEVQEGLKAGESVVLSANAKSQLKDGDRIKVK